MVKRLLLYLAAGALGAGGAVHAQAPTVATPEQTTVTAPAKITPKKVCRERQRSGSHLTNIVCKTPEQWAQLDEDQFDHEAEYGIPGNRVASGRAFNSGSGGGPR